MRRSVVACIASLATFAPAALACGVCIEDKIAATYDHAVVVRAAQRHQVVVFTALDGFADGRDLARAAGSAAARLTGVDRASVRSTPAPAALSFALDPQLQTPERAASAIEHSANAPGLKVTVLKVMH